MTRAKRFTLSAALAGLLVGGLAAVVVARDDPSNGSGGPDTWITQPGALQIAAAITKDPQPDSGHMKLIAGSLSTQLTRPDPAGGAPWTVRAFKAHLLYEARIFRPGTAPLPRRITCVQLGREVDRQFGWIDATNTFRPVPVDLQSVTPTQCGSSQPDTKHHPELSVTVPITDPRGPDPQVRGSVVWGYTGNAVDRVSLRAAGRSDAIKPAGSLGAFLSFYGPRHSAAGASLDIRYPDGKTNHATPYGLPNFAMKRAYQPVAATLRVAARAPDPGGGPSWGLRELQTRGGFWCVGVSGYIIGDRIGSIDPLLGLLSEESPGLNGGCPGAKGLSHKLPSYAGFGTGSAMNIPQLDPARSLLRLQPGRFVLTGQTSADVRLITIQSPRDLRSVIPTGNAHAFMAVYDGDFETGSIQLTFYYKDGSTAKQRVDTGM